MLTRICVAAFAAGILLGSTALRAETINFTANLDGKSEVPATDSMATGHVTAAYDSMTKEFTWKVDYQGLSGPATAAHFHGPAPKGKNADVMVPVTGALTSPISGKTTLTDPQAKALNDGQLYFNIHTAAHKSGEIRGWLEKGM